MDVKRNYPCLVSKFFIKHLAATKNVSINTIHSYRDTFMLFNNYLENNAGFKLEKISISDFSRDRILDFLNFLEREREYAISSRNQRLAALKSFFKFVQVECPESMSICQSILAIECKKAEKPVIEYLSNEQIDILMEQPNISTFRGRRDLAMLLLLYDSGARVQEFCDIKVCDIRVESPAVVHLFGKGRKNRDVPLTKPCATILNRYMQDRHLNSPEHINDPLFVNPQGKKLSRSGVTYILEKYVALANKNSNASIPEVTPHCLRHSKAMHLVEAGTNLIYIRDFLGHESIETTQVYAKANPEARRKALEAMDKKMNMDAMPDWNLDPDLKAFLKGL